MIKILLYSSLLTFTYLEIALCNSPNDLVRDVFVKSSRYQLWQSKLQEISMGKKSAQGSIPLRLESTIYRRLPMYGDEQESALLGNSILESSDVLSLDLVYQSYSSFKNTFGVDYTRNQYDKTYSTTSSARSYDISNRFEYNLSNGAGNSDNNISRAQELANLSLTELQNIKSLNADYIDFYQKILSFLILDCKIKNQLQIKGTVDEAMQRGKALLSINSISKKDYLNYESLQIDLEKNIATLSNDLFQARYDVEGLGLNADKDVDRLKFSFLCQNYTNFSTPDKMINLSENIDLEIIQKQMDLNSLQIKKAKRDEISDISPYVEIGMSSDLTQESKDYRIVAGLTVGWDVPNTKLKNEIRYKSLAKNYTAGDYHLTKRKTEFEFTSLKQDLKYLNQILEITKKNLKSNDELLKILKLENSLRKGDSLNFANAVNNRISLINNYFDLVQQSETKLAQIKLLQDGKYVIR